MEIARARTKSCRTFLLTSVAVSGGLPWPIPRQPSRRDRTFHEFASEWFEAMRNEGLARNTLLDYEWQLTHHLLPFFARHSLSEITIAEVDRYRQLKVREGRPLRYLDQ